MSVAYYYKLYIVQLHVHHTCVIELVLMLKALASYRGPYFCNPSPHKNPGNRLALSLSLTPPLSLSLPPSLPPSLSPSLSLSVDILGPGQLCAYGMSSPLVINDEGRGGYGFVCKGIDLSVKLHVCVFMHLRSLLTACTIFICAYPLPHVHKCILHVHICTLLLQALLCVRV